MSTPNSNNFNNHTIDYNNYDILDVYAKKDKVDRIIESYESFSWKLIHNDENEKYVDANNLTFARPHKIKNKDYLQYNQIEMENIINDIGKCETYKHSKSTIWGLCLILPIAFLIILFLSLYLNSKINLLLTCILLGTLILLASLSTIFLVKVYRKELHNYNKKYNSLQKKLDDICNKVKEKMTE